MGNKDLINAETVKEYAKTVGASVVGIVASADFASAPDGFKPSDVLDGCLCVVVLGAPFPREAIIDDSVEYTDIRNAINEKMNDIAKKTAKKIASEGYKAKAVSGLSGQISLKHAAELAGLGVIGKNYLLANPEYGSLLWFSAVLTDAALTADKKAMHTVCGNCGKCVEICPSKALDNPASFGKKKCSDTCFKIVNGKWKIKCFLCRKVCPNNYLQES